MISCRELFGQGTSQKLKNMVSVKTLSFNTTEVQCFWKRTAMRQVVREQNTLTFDIFCYRQNPEEGSVGGLVSNQ